MTENHTKLEVAKTQMDLGLPHIERAFFIIKTAPDHEKKSFMNTLLGLGKEVERMMVTLENSK